MVVIEVPVPEEQKNWPHPCLHTGFEVDLKEDHWRQSYQPNRKSTHLAVNLRCMKLEGSLATLYSGGGITKNSDPLTECIEIQNKIQTIKKVL